MSKVLNKIMENEQYFSPVSRYEDFVEVFDDETGESINMPCHCAFNCMVLALKDMHHTGHVSIIHKRDTWSWHDHREEVFYAEYALLHDGYVHEVDRHGGYSAYAEREVA